MKKTNSLLSYRFSSKNQKNIIKGKNLSFPVSEIQTSSHNHCPACGNEEGWLIAEVDRVGFPCDTVICKSCQFVINDSYLSNPISFYEKYWGEEHWGNPEENWMRRTSPDAYSWKRMAYVAMNLGNQFQGIDNILEIGCGDGCNLFPYHLFGKSVLGCDYDDKYLDMGRAQGMNLISGGIDSISDDKKFDLIQLVHVFEHMLDLDEEISKIKKLIKRNGFVYVEVPGILNWNRKNSESVKEDGFSSSNNFLSYLQLQHNYHFDLAHLLFFWERNGLKVISCDEWARAIFQLKDHNNKSQYDNRSYPEILSYLQSIEGDYKRTLFRRRKAKIFSPVFIASKIKRGLVELMDFANR